MRYIKEAVVLFVITMIGEWLNQVLPLPIPTGVYGLFLLLFLLCSGLLKLESVEKTGSFLLEIMPILFIPASVGLIESFGEIQDILIPLVVICVVSTVVVMAVTGKTMQILLSMRKKGEK